MNRFKIALVGAKGTGKTSFICKALGRRTSETPSPTIGIDYFSADLDHKELGVMPILAWDCASSDTYRELTVGTFAPHCEALLVFYDCSRRRTFSPHTIEWIQQMRSQMKGSPTIMIIANKTDLASDGELVEEGSEYAKANGYLFEQCSVKEDSKNDLSRFITKVVESILLRDKDRHLSMPNDGSNYLIWALNKS